MRRFVPLGLIVALLFAAVVASSFPKTADAQGTAGLVSSVISKMERNHRNLRSLRAGISMEVYNAQLRDSERRSGTVLYQPAAGRNANVRIEWQKPSREILAVSNGEYTLFRPRLNMAYKGNARSGQARKAGGGLLDMMNMSGQQIRSRFEPWQDVREETLWGGVRTIHLTLVPKGGASYKYMEIWVDDDGMPVQTKVVEKNDDASTVRLMNLEKNGRVSPDDFRLQLESGVKIIKG
ncbi:MAG TPA: outer membrane lipoprotein carrier protein LolA [Pyrinomonadaceae bacterium]|jgi:outer membrane lipoprotein-sorting protein